MSVKRRRTEMGVLFFVTFTCYKWKPLFKEVNLYQNIYNWFQILNDKDVKVCGFVIMSNHLHLLLHIPKGGDELHKYISNAKRFFAYEIVKRLKAQRSNSRLKELQNGVKTSDGKKGQIHQVFQRSYDAKLCLTEGFVLQKLNYIHSNPVKGKWNLAENYLEYNHSSAQFYEESVPHDDCDITHYLEFFR